jgi:hypothetical protein
MRRHLRGEFDDDDDDGEQIDLFASIGEDVDGEEDEEDEDEGADLNGVSGEVFCYFVKLLC